MTTVPPALLVSHPGLGEGLLEAARGILGRTPAIDVLSNAGLSAEELGRRVEAWLEQHPGPAFVLTDLAPGSCGMAARRAVRAHPQAAVITGVNLPLVLALAGASPGLDHAALCAHLTARGRDAILLFPPGSS